MKYINVAINLPVKTCSNNLPMPYRRSWTTLMWDGVLWCRLGIRQWRGL